MKTPEEIKKGLECCYSPVEPMLRCEACPYYGSIVCKMRLHTDALACIQQLERERDAAVTDIHKGCSTCKHYYYNRQDDGTRDCLWFDVCKIEDHWEWRGVPEKEEVSE